VQLALDTGSLPLLQPPPAGDARSEAELGRQMAPRYACVQDEQDSLQCLSIGEATPSSRAASFRLREQGLEDLPELVRDAPRRCLSHRHLLQLDNGCRRLRSSLAGPCPIQSGRASRPVRWRSRGLRPQLKRVLRVKRGSCTEAAVTRSRSPSAKGIRLSRLERMKAFEISTFGVARTADRPTIIDSNRAKPTAKADYGMTESRRLLRSVTRRALVVICCLIPISLPWVHPQRP
jgi:hypothetical protein